MFGTRCTTALGQGNRTVRHGLTLVEMLVAMALTLMIVFAIVQMFQYVGERTTNSRAVLELAGQVRAASNLLQQDLSCHTASGQPWNVNENGYLEFTERSGNDKASPSSLNGDIDDVLAFTAESKEIPFTGQFNNTTYTSHLAEIIWWVAIDANGDTNLYRRVLLIRPDLAVNSVGGSLQSFYNSNDISVRQSGSTLVANTLPDLAKRQNRFAHTGDDGGGGNGPYPLDVNKLNGRIRNGAQLATDVVLSKVAAFDLRVYDPRAIVYEKTVSGNRTLLVPTDPGYVATDALSSTGGTTTVTGPTPPPVVIDDGAAALAGSWLSAVGQGYNNGLRYCAPGNGANVATYTFSGLPAGQYRVYSTWFPHANRATNTPYKILDGTTLLGTANVDQESTPNDITYASTGFKQVGGVYTINSGTLVVKISDAGTPIGSVADYTIADAVLIQGLPVTTTSTGSGASGEGAFVDLGYAPSLDRYTAPTSSTPPPPPTPPSPVIIDNVGATLTAGWLPAGGQGHNSNLVYCPPTNGTNVATYTFSGLPAGRYRVYATWFPHANRSNGTPYTVLDGTTSLGTVNVSQESSPSGVTVGTTAFSDLGSVYTITSGTLVVKISDAGTPVGSVLDYAIADAVRVAWDSAIPSTSLGSSNYYVPLSQFSRASHTKSSLTTPTWDTWPTFFENNGVDEDGDGVVDNVAGTAAAAASNQSSAYETSPPYAVPLRGVSISIRVYEPQSRQVIQRSVVENLFSD